MLYKKCTLSLVCAWINSKDKYSITKGHCIVKEEDTWTLSPLSLCHWSISKLNSWIKTILAQWQRVNERQNGLTVPIKRKVTYEDIFQRDILRCGSLLIGRKTGHAYKKGVVFDKKTTRDAWNGNHMGRDSPLCADRIAMGNTTDLV